MEISTGRGFGKVISVIETNNLNGEMILAEEYFDGMYLND
jgi:hypothetical protein